MPNIGRPSQDCYECRRRKVKCDLRMPECQRCFKSGKRCPGYRHERQVIFKHESVTSLSGPAGARDRRRTQWEDDFAKNNSSDSTNFDALSRLATPKLSLDAQCLRNLDDFVLRELDHDAFDPGNPATWEQNAAILSLSLFSLDAGDYRNWGYTEFLPQMFEEASTQSLLRLACTALGLAYLANRFNSVQAQMTRDQAFGRALRAAKSQLEDLQACVHDEVPVAIWLLGVYENVAGLRSGAESTTATSWNMHVMAIIEIIKLRGPSQLQTQRGRNIFWILCASLQVRCLIADVEYPSFIDSWLADSSYKMPATDKALAAINRSFSQAAAISHHNRQLQLSRDNKLNSTTILRIRHDLEGLYKVYHWGENFLPPEKPVQPCVLYMRNMYRLFYLRACHVSLDLLAGSRESATSCSVQREGNELREQITNNVNRISNLVIESAALLIDSTSQANESGGDDAQTCISNGPVDWSGYLKVSWCLRILATRMHLLEASQAEEVGRLLVILSSKYCICHA